MRHRPINEVPGPSAVQERPIRLLAVFNTLVLYGMELTVIETFDHLRPEVEPTFLIQRATDRYELPVVKELQRRGLSYAFFSDHCDWPRIGRPRSWSDCWLVPYSALRANLDVMRAARKADAVYVPSTSALLFSYLVIAASPITRKRVIYSFHNLPSRSLLMRVVRPALAMVRDLVHKTEWSKNEALRFSPRFSSSRNWVIPSLAMVESRSGDAQRTLGNHEDQLNIVFAGQISVEKGVYVLLDAFKLLAGRYLNVHLHIAGDTLSDGREFAHAIATTGFAGRISTWGYCRDIEQFMRVAYVYVHPTLPSLCNESFGRGVAEAMSRGVPAVAFRSGALVELIQNEVTGLLCDDEAPGCLAAAIGRLIESRELHDRLGRNALQKFQASYSAAAVRGKWLELFGWPLPTRDSMPCGGPASSCLRPESRTPPRT